MQRIQWEGGVPVGQRGAEAALEGHAQASGQPHSASGNPIWPCGCPRHGQLSMTSFTHVHDQSLQGPTNHQLCSSLVAYVLCNVCKDPIPRL